MKGRSAFVTMLMAAVGSVAACSSDPIGGYRIGAAFDVGAFGREHGEENVRSVRFDQERYSYRECSLCRRGATYFVDVAPDGRIAGLTVWKSCGVNDLPKTSARLEAQLSAPYADGKGGLRDGIEVRTRYEPGSRRIVATCHSPEHAAAVQAFRKRTKQPQR